MQGTWKGNRIVTIKIPNSVFDGLVKWMMRGPWPGYIQEAIDDHLHAYCDRYDLDTFEKLAEKIGPHWVSTLNDIAMNDFLGRETEDGNVVDLYLKRRGWNETAIVKAYLKGIRESCMSLYEVSDIRPGESFLARDLILGGEPVRVEEKSGTQTMLQWEHIAMRLVEVRGHRIIAGGVLPYEQKLSEQFVEEIHKSADEAAVGLKDIVGGQDDDPDPELVRNLALVMVLKMSAPLFSEAWLAGNVLDPDDLDPPTLVNADGDEIEFIKLHCKFAKGTTQKQVRELLNRADDMKPASASIWNWIGLENRKPQPHRKNAKATTYKSELQNGELVSGMLELVGNALEANVNSANRAELLTERLHTLLGDRVARPIMVRQTLKQAMAEHQLREQPEHRQQLDLPSDVESKLMKDFYDRHYRETLEQPIPMLDNLSPRQAVKTTEGRTKVIAWLKLLETGEAKTRRSKKIDAYDFTWMWQELGVFELRK